MSEQTTWMAPAMVRICSWRVGRKLGRTIYAMLGEEPSDGDMLIGVMDDRRVAEHVVACHNQALTGRSS